MNDKDKDKSTEIEKRERYLKPRNSNPAGHMLKAGLTLGIGSGGIGAVLFGPPGAVIGSVTGAAMGIYSEYRRVHRDQG